MYMYSLTDHLAKDATQGIKLSHSCAHFDTLLRRSQDLLLCILNGNG